MALYWLKLWRIFVVSWYFRKYFPAQNNSSLKYTRVEVEWRRVVPANCSTFWPTSSWSRIDCSRPAGENNSNKSNNSHGWVEYFKNKNWAATSYFMAGRFDYMILNAILPILKHVKCGACQLALFQITHWWPMLVVMQSFCGQPACCLCLCDVSLSLWFVSSQYDGRFWIK